MENTPKVPNASMTLSELVFDGRPCDDLRPACRNTVQALRQPSINIQGQSCFGNFALPLHLASAFLLQHSTEGVFYPG